MKKKNKKTINWWFFIASMCYYITAIILLISKDKNGMAITNLCLGSCFLCLSMSNSDKKAKDNNDNKE